jgi:uncharacterized damage-inducible protein DinB
MASLFRHKAWANAELLQHFAAQDAGLPKAERHTAIRILNHAHVVDRIFAAHLQGVAHGYAGTNTKETPTLDQLSASVRETDGWYLDYVSKARPDALAETIAFTFTDGSRGRMSREEMLAHVITHGSFHRGQVSRLIPAVANATPSDLLTGYLHQAEPGRRD